MTTARTGVRGSYKSGGLEVEAEYNMADAAAMAAIGIGAAGTFLPEISTTFVGLPLMFTGLGYFGVKAIRPNWVAFGAATKALPAKDNPNGGLLLLGVGAGVLWWCWKRKKEQDAERDVWTAVTTAPEGFSMPEIPAAPVPVPAPAQAEALPAADLAPGGAGAPAAPTAPFAPPAGDTNLYWWPMEDPKEDAKKNTVRWGQQNLGGPDDSWIAWATGAEEGEGYLPDDWAFGTKAKIKEGAIEGAKTGMDIVTDPFIPDEPLIPRWLIPAMGIGALGLVGYWISKK